MSGTALASSDPLFFAAEVEVYQPNPGTFEFDQGFGSRAFGTLSRRALSLEQPGMIRASDLGYRTPEDGAGRVLLYPPVLDSAFEIDRRVGLAPGDASTRTYGAIRLSNLGGRFDEFAQTRNSDNRPARILLGRKTRQPALGIEVDPPYADLVPFFGGVALPWSLDEEHLTIPLADPAAWLDRPVQDRVYAGTGGLEGGAELAGKPLPMTRGGTNTAPVLDVPLVLVDGVASIYQWTDGPGTVQTLYEGGKAVFVYDGDVANLYVGSAPASGRYRTCNARGVLQLGRAPVATLSADVTGAFPGGSTHYPGGLALAAMVQDMGIAAGRLDVASFQAADFVRPYDSGYHLGTEQMRGLDLVALILGSIGGRLVSTRSGLLSCFLLAPLAVGASPEVMLSTANVVSVRPQPLPATLDPPPYRVQVGYGRVWQTQTSGLNATVTPARRQQLGAEYRYATAFAAAVLRRYRRPNDLAPVPSILAHQGDALAVAGTMLDLFASHPGYHAVEVPLAVAPGIDLGTIVHLTWPLADLAAGRIGQVVGEQIRSGDGTVTFPVLMSPWTGPATFSATAELGIFQLGIHELA